MSRTVFRRTHSVDRRHGLSREDFERTYLAPSRPVVLTGVYDPATVERWSATLAASEARVACVVARRGNLSEISDADRPDVSQAASLPDAQRVHDRPAARRSPPPDARSLRFRAARRIGRDALRLLRRLAVGAPGDHRRILALSRRSSQRCSRRSAPRAAPGERSRHAESSALPHPLVFPPAVARPQARPPLLAGRDLQPVPQRGTALARRGLRRRGPRALPAVARAEAWDADLAPGDVLFLPTYWWHEIRVDDWPSR